LHIPAGLGGRDPTNLSRQGLSAEDLAEDELHCIEALRASMQSSLDEIDSEINILYY
jgi:hypothetical protein